MAVCIRVLLLLIAFSLLMKIKSSSGLTELFRIINIWLLVLAPLSGKTLGKNYLICSHFCYH